MPKQKIKKPFAPYCACEDFPGPKVQSDDEFLAAVTQRGSTKFHPGCTCRMGPADARWAVVETSCACADCAVYA